MRWSYRLSDLSQTARTPRSSLRFVLRLRLASHDDARSAIGENLQALFTDIDAFLFERLQKGQGMRLNSFVHQLVVDVVDDGARQPLLLGFLVAGNRVHHRIVDELVENRGFDNLGIRHQTARLLRSPRSFLLCRRLSHMAPHSRVDVEHAF